MAGQTTYYQLETYESNDVPDLRDQYNSSMNKIDAALNTIANTANSAATGVSDAVSNANAALNAASAAQQSAGEAATNAANAISIASDAAAQIAQASTDASAALQAASSAQLDITNFKNTFPADYARTDIGTSAIHCYFKCVRGVARIDIAGTANYAGAWDATTIGTIPAGYRPSDQIIVPLMMSGTRSTGMPRLVISTNGTITTDGAGVALGSNKEIETFLSWPVG
jgi:hypothetical protein